MIPPDYRQFLEKMEFLTKEFEALRTAVAEVCGSGNAPKLPRKYAGFVRKKEVANHIGCSVKMVESRMKKGLPYFKFGKRTILFKLEDVDKFIERSRISQIVR